MCMNTSHEINLYLILIFGTFLYNHLPIGLWKSQEYNNYFYLFQVPPPSFLHGQSLRGLGPLLLWRPCPLSPAPALPPGLAGIPPRGLPPDPPARLPPGLPSGEGARVQERIRQKTSSYLLECPQSIS